MINKDKIFVIKKSDSILISHDGKKLVIDINNKLFNQLKDLDKQQIRDWYSNR